MYIVSCHQDSIRRNWHHLYEQFIHFTHCKLHLKSTPGIEAIPQHCMHHMFKVGRLMEKYGLSRNAGNSEPAMPQSKLQQDECQWKRCAKVWSLFPINLGCQEDNGLAKPFDWGLGICAALKARFCNGVVWGLNTDFNDSWFLLKVLIPGTC